MKCKFCGTENPPGSTLCSVCRKRLGTTATAPQEKFRRTSEYQPRSESMMPRFKTQTPVYGGVILIFTGIMGIGSMLVVGLYASFFAESADDFAFYSALVGGLSIFVLIGGGMTIARRAWGLCLAASIAGVVLSLFGSLCGILGLMIAVVGVIFVVLAKDEFE